MKQTPKLISIPMSVDGMSYRNKRQWKLEFTVISESRSTLGGFNKQSEEGIHH